MAMQTNLYGLTTNTDDITGSGVTRTSEIYDKKIPLDISKEITELDPDRFPFIRFLEAISNKETCDSYKYEWLEEEDKPIMDTVKTGSSIISSNSATGLILNLPDLFVAGDIIRVIDVVTPFPVETMQISSKTDAYTYVVVRNIDAAGAQTSFAIGSEVLRIGSMFAENTVSADPDNTEPVWRYNLTQTFKESVAISGRFDAMKVLGRSSELSWQMKQKMRHFNEGLEGAMLFGNRAYVSGSAGKTLTGGMKWFVSTYGAAANTVNMASTTFDENWLMAQSNYLFRYGSKKKLVITSGAIISKIASFNLQYLRQNKEASKTLGVEVTDFNSNHGTLSMVHSRFLEESSIYNKMMIVIDPQYIKKRYISGRDTQIRMNVQSNDLDGKKHEILADCGLEVRVPNAHHIIQNINTTIS